jgi:predicted phage-related endonuclease
MAKKKKTTALAEYDPYHIGGSTISAIMGIHPNRTPLDAYNSILQISPPEPESPPMRRGKLFEHVAAEEYTRKTGIELEGSQMKLVDPEYPFLQGSIDYKKRDLPDVCEIKIPGLSVFARYKRDGLPAHLILQLQYYLGLMNLSQRGVCERGEWIIFNTEMVDLKNFTVEYEAELFIHMRVKAVKWWEDHIIARVPPALDVDADEMKAFKAIEGEVKQIDTPQFAEAMMMFQEVKRLKADHDYLETIAKDKLKSAVGGKGKYAGSGGRLYWSERAGRKTPDMPRLRAAEPIDRAIEKNFGKGPYKKMLALLDDCRTDIDTFIKAGAPYDVLQAYFTNENE